MWNWCDAMDIRGKSLQKSYSRKFYLYEVLKKDCNRKDANPSQDAQ
jgi:hypothetical protein